MQGWARVEFLMYDTTNAAWPKRVLSGYVPCGPRRVSNDLSPNRLVNLRIAGA